MPLINICKWLIFGIAASGAPVRAEPIVIAANGADQSAEVQAVLNRGGEYLFTGKLKTGPIEVRGKRLVIDFAPDAVLSPAAKTDKLWTFKDSNVTIRRLSVDGARLAQTALDIEGGTLTAGRISITQLGFKTPATAGVFGLELLGVRSAHVDTLRCADLHSVGNGIYGDMQGAVRCAYAQHAGTVEIGTLEVSGGDATEDNDYFHAAVGSTGGVIHNLIARYNGKTRRIFKAQSGNWMLEQIDIQKGDDFKPDNSETDVGTHNLNAIDYAGPLSGSITVKAGKADCTGFAACVGDSGGGGAVRVEHDVVLQGSPRRVIRTDAETDGPQNKPTVGFYGRDHDGSCIDGAVVTGFETRALGAATECAR